MGGGAGGGEAVTLLNQKNKAAFFFRKKENEDNISTGATPDCNRNSLNLEGRGIVVVYLGVPDACLACENPACSIEAL